MRPVIGMTSRDHKEPERSDNPGAGQMRPVARDHSFARPPAKQKTTTGRPGSGRNRGRQRTHAVGWAESVIVSYS